ncbi:MAG: hypothetical protein AAF664_19475 [Planctomycetota bacterium]
MSETQETGRSKHPKNHLIPILTIGVTGIFSAFFVYAFHYRSNGLLRNYSQDLQKQLKTYDENISNSRLKSEDRFRMVYEAGSTISIQSGRLLSTFESPFNSVRRLQFIESHARRLQHRLNVDDVDFSPIETQDITRRLNRSLLEVSKGYDRLLDNGGEVTPLVEALTFQSPKTPTTSADLDQQSKQLQSRIDGLATWLSSWRDPDSRLASAGDTGTAEYVNGQDSPSLDPPLFAVGVVHSIDSIAIETIEGFLHQYCRMTYDFAWQDPTERIFYSPNPSFAQQSVDALRGLKIPDQLPAESTEFWNAVRNLLVNNLASQTTHQLDPRQREACLEAADRLLQSERAINTNTARGSRWIALATMTSYRWNSIPDQLSQLSKDWNTRNDHWVTFKRDLEQDICRQIADPAPTDEPLIARFDDQLRMWQQTGQGWESTRLVMSVAAAWHPELVSREDARQRHYARLANELKGYQSQQLALAVRALSTVFNGDASTAFEAAEAGILLQQPISSRVSGIAWKVASSQIFPSAKPPSEPPTGGNEKTTQITESANASNSADLVQRAIYWNETLEAIAGASENRGGSEDILSLARAAWLIQADQMSAADAELNKISTNRQFETTVSRLRQLISTPAE